MRLAAVNDAWRSVNKTDKYPFRLLDFKARDIDGFKAEVEITFHSAVTAICGKNGVGKTTLMRFLYSAFYDGDTRQAHGKFSRSSFEAQLFNNNRPCSLDEVKEGGFSVFYLEPSKECTRIIEYLRDTSNVEELLEGLDANEAFQSEKLKAMIERLVGKTYQAITFYEVVDAMPHEFGYSFPYFKVTLPSGSTYTNVDMGMGELACLYVAWFLLHYIDSRSLLFIEEPENFISAYSQLRLMDLIAEQSFAQKLWIILSTHSEHVLSKVGIDNIKVLSQYCVENLSAISSPNHVRRYLAALGVSSSSLGIYLVEDELAKYFLEYILGRVDPDVLSDYSVIQMRCDSNIEKIVTHFEPTPKPSFDIIAVFDADQSNKIKPLSGKHIYVTALPSSKALAPELELWPILVARDEQIANSLDIDLERLREAIDNHRYGDLHDRYGAIAEACRKPMSSLVNSILKEWYIADGNQLLVKMFHLALKCRRQSLPIQASEKAGAFEVVCASFVESLGQNNCRVNAPPGTKPYIDANVGFDGSGFFV